MSTVTPPEQVVYTDDEESPLLLYLGVFLLLVVPTVILIVLLLTDLNLAVGRALGVNLPENANLVIYDATCDGLGDTPIVHLTYWTSESAPLTLNFDGFKSPVISSPAGIQTITLSVRAKDSCPSAIILTDESRQRAAGRSVEVIR